MDSRNRFELFLPLILRNEGGYVNHPADKGGPTNKGITQNVYTNYLKELGKDFKDVRYILPDEVFTIYYSKYWVPSHCPELPMRTSCVHFDTCVNWGITGGAKLLQMTIGVQVDGIIGQITLDKISKFNDFDLANRYCETRLERRYAIVKKDPTQQVFLKGWLNRDLRVKKYISENI